MRRLFQFTLGLWLIAPTLFAASADVGVTNVCPATVTAGTGYTNTITLTNIGPSAATNVVVVDTLPNGAVSNFTVAVLANGSRTNFLVLETAPGTGPVTNKATVSATTPDPNLLNNTNATVSAVTASADVGVTNVCPATVTAGTGYTNTITVANLGPSVASNVVVLDNGPGGLLLSNVVAALPVGGTTNFLVLRRRPAPGL